MMRISTLIATAAAALIATAGAAAPTTFAQYQQTSDADTVQLTNGTGSTGQVLAINNPVVKFDFLLPALVAAGFGSQNAIFSMQGFITQPAVNYGGFFLAQKIDSGSISFTRQTPAPANTANGNRTNLLTINFTNAQLTGQPNSTSGSILASTANSTLVYTSDFLDFSTVTSLDFALALSSITGGGLGQANSGESLNAFTADSTGTFSSDPAPRYVAPEPGALGLVGLGFAGLALRRRRAAAA